MFTATIELFMYDWYLHYQSYFHSFFCYYKYYAYEYVYANTQVRFCSEFCADYAMKHGVHGKECVQGPRQYCYFDREVYDDLEHPTKCIICHDVFKEKTTLTVVGQSQCVIWSFIWFCSIWFCSILFGHIYYVTVVYSYFTYFFFMNIFYAIHSFSILFFYSNDICISILILYLHVFTFYFIYFFRPLYTQASLLLMRQVSWSAGQSGVSSVATLPLLPISPERKSLGWM